MSRSAQTTDEPVFEAPWQAQAFGLATSLRDQGVFSGTEWADRLGAELVAAGAAGSQSSAEIYWLAWLSALERLTTEKGAASADELLARKAAWHRAARATPHGHPIELGAELQT